MGVRALRLRRAWENLTEGPFYALLVSCARVLSALPSRWVLSASDALGDAMYALDRRARKAGLQNLTLVFGDMMSPAEKRRILRSSMRGAVRSVFILLHAAPLTEDRFRRWVDVDPQVEQTLKIATRSVKGAVAVSAHLGAWELLLGMAGLFQDELPLKFLAEASANPAVDRFLAYLRGSAGGHSTLRKGGATAMSSHVRSGGVAGIVVDRNVRRVHGGIWVPFFDLPARTSPLPALLARRNDLPIVPVFMLPRPDGRYRLYLAEEPSMSVRTDDRSADLLEIMVRVNRIVERVILHHPEAWSWTIKRWKSRPTKEPGRYPAYSVFDPPGLPPGFDAATSPSGADS